MRAAVAIACGVGRVLAVFCAIAGAAPALPDEVRNVASTEAVAALQDAIAARLQLMDDVARYKWNHGLPVLDAAREAALLDRTTAEAVARGIPETYARRVVAAQIAASRARQEELLQRWQDAAPPPTFADVPDLAREQRPAIDAATAALLTRLRTAMCSLDDTARTALAAPPQSFDGSTRVWATAVDPLWPPPSECRD